MRMHDKERNVVFSAMAVITLCAIAFCCFGESDDGAGTLSIDKVSLSVENGIGEWTVTASGWTGQAYITYSISHNGEELDSITEKTNPGLESIFGTTNFHIVKGETYQIKVSLDKYTYAVKEYTTTSSAIIFGSDSMEVGEQNSLRLMINPSDASCSKYNWTVSDKTLATVNDGIVTAKKTGTVYVSAVSTEDASISTAEFGITITESSYEAGYRINVLADEGGTAKADKTRAFPGEWVELEQEADYGYRFVAWEANTALKTIDDYTAFLMPEYEVTVKAIFKETYPVESAVRTGDNGTVVMPITALESKGMHDDDNLKATVNIVKDYPGNIPDTATVYSVKISYNNVEVTNLGGMMTIILDYENKSGGSPSVYSVSDDGKTVYVIEGDYDQYNNTMTFQTGKLTLFAVSCDPVEPLIETNTTPFGYIVLAAAFILIIIAVVILIGLKK